MTELLAHGPLMTLSTQLTAEHPGARVLDGRRPKLGHDLQPVTQDQPTDQHAHWSVPSALAGIGMLLVMAAE